MPLVILHHLLNVFVQLANKRGLKSISPVMILVLYDYSVLPINEKKIIMLLHFNDWKDENIWY
jgi:hypothetical protein